jgi:hypothetical protein
MDMEFGIILARISFWRGEKNHKPLVDGFARGGIAEGSERRRAGFGEFSGKILDNFPRGRPRHAQDRDRGAARAGGNGKNRVLVHGRNLLFILVRVTNGPRYAVLAPFAEA